MHRRIILIGALGLALAAVGCGSLQSGAKAQFVEDTACPTDRVTVTPGARVEEHPPPDVAADPERLRLWRQIQESKRADDPFTYFDVAGCGKTAKMLCIRDSDNGSRPWCSHQLSAEGPVDGPRTAAPEDDADLASLPHVAERYDMPAVPSSLQGLSIRLHPTLVGPSAGIPQDVSEARCTSDFEDECAMLGWKVVGEPDAPADLDVTFFCSGGLLVRTRNDQTIEVRLPDPGSHVAATFTHDGRVVETLPVRMPMHVVCQATGSSSALVAGCTERIRALSHSLFLGAVIESKALNDFAASERARSQSSERAP